MSRFNLRRKPRISYYEIEEPNLDEYVYCDECTDFVYEYCAIHGPLLVVPDDKVSRAGVPAWVPRAALTVPGVFLHIAPSVIPGAGLGVFSTLTLPRGVRFGPYQGKHMAEAKSMYCWQIKSADLKSRTVVDAADGETSNWMRYVNCARNWHEQNLVAYQYQGQIYYRTIKIIPRFTELLVFYGSEFANALGIELRYYNAPPRFTQYGAPSAKRPKATQESEKKTDLKERVLLTDENQNEIPKTEKEKVLNVVEEKSKAIIQYTCNDCGKTIQDKSLFIMHIKNHNNIKSNIKTNMERNNYIKSKNVYFECKSCDYKAATGALLEKHMRLHDKDRIHECNVCQRRFTENGSLKIHLKLHTGEKPYECNVCQRRFTQNSNLKTHLKSHTGEKPYECNVCQRRFTQNSNLKTHLKLHTGEKPYECNVCQRRFTLNGDLKKHLRLHTGEKPYECNVCQRRFTENGHLKTHLRSHTGDKPYECIVCQRRFTENGSLKNHLRLHTGEKPYECNVCQRRFTKNDHLKTHLRLHTGDKPYECNICQHRFTHNSSLKNHLRLHTGEKPYECNVCQRRFTQNSYLKKHLKLHTGEKPYECNICESRFTQRYSLKTHLKIHSR